MPYESKKSAGAKGNFGTPEMRRKLRKLRQEIKVWRARCVTYVEQTGRSWRTYPEPKPTFPTELIGMLCGAKNRQGLPCKISKLFSNGRCKFHGGASTGPKTKRGKKKSAKNGFKKIAKNPMGC